MTKTQKTKPGTKYVGTFIDRQDAEALANRALNNGRSVASELRILIRAAISSPAK